MARVAGGHQRLTHQHRVVPGLGQDRGVVASPDTGLGHAHHPGRHQRRHADGTIGVHLEGDQISLVHSDQGGTDRQSPLQFGFVVELKYLKSGAAEAEVIARLDEADAQLTRYLADPKLEAIRPPKGWKAVSVAFVATEACWLRELGGTAQRLPEASS